MSNRILYYASTPEEVHQCAYSLLKYLDVYNLKPPVAHSLTIYTNDPASLEAYGSFFHSFELKPASENLGAILKNAGSESGANVLYMANNTYVQKPLEPVFAAIATGATFSEENESGQLVRGWKTSASSPDLTQNRQDPGAFIARYSQLKEFNSFLRYFFRRYQEESVPNQVKLLHHVDAVSIQQKRDAFFRLPFYVRWARKVMGKGFNIGARV